jgi:hypothetical protein
MGLELANDEDIFDTDAEFTGLVVTRLVGYYHIFF